MPDITYEDAPVPVRDDLVRRHAEAWRHIAAPGTWLTGAERVAIAAEGRNAPGCDLCEVRREALSPHTVDGEHDHLGALRLPIVDVIHRVVTDPARLGRSWYRSVLDGGLTAEEYVETIGVLATTVTVDTFARAMGMPLRPLPEPQPGEPTRMRPRSASQGPAWVPWIAGEDAEGDEIPDFGPQVSNVRRALSLVPSEARNFMGIVGVQYLPADEMRDFDREVRAISRAQMELIAGRISAINQCAY